MRMRQIVTGYDPNHAGCVITTAESFLFLFFSFTGYSDLFAND